MERKKKLLFVINPISGGKNKNGFENRVRELLDEEKFEMSFAYTAYPNHASALAKEAVGENYDSVVAVGGDGTINEVASQLANTQTALGIIPEGSGNGLALYLGVPLNERSAIRRLQQFESIKIDSGKINDEFFFNMAGIGFDASVSDRFATDKMRGPIGYLKAVLQEISTYKPRQYELIIDGVPYQREAFMVSVANSPQYGNNAYIAPDASITDGLLDVCIIRKFPLYLFPLLVFHLFNKSADQTEYVEIIPGKEIAIHMGTEEVVHIDGEPKSFGKDLHISVSPASLSVIC